MNGDYAFKLFWSFPFSMRLGENRRRAPKFAFAEFSFAPRAQYMIY